MALETPSILHPLSPTDARGIRVPLRVLPTSALKQHSGDLAQRLGGHRENPGLEPNFSRAVSIGYRQSFQTFTDE